MAFKLKHGLCLLLILGIAILVLCPDQLHEKFQSAKVPLEQFVTYPVEIGPNYPDGNGGDYEEPDAEGELQGPEDEREKIKKWKQTVSQYLRYLRSHKSKERFTLMEGMPDDNIGQGGGSPYPSGAPGEIVEVGARGPPPPTPYDPHHGPRPTYVDRSGTEFAPEEDDSVESLTRRLMGGGTAPPPPQIKPMEPLMKPLLPTTPLMKPIPKKKTKTKKENYSNIAIPIGPDYPDGPGGWDWRTKPKPKPEFSSEFLREWEAPEYEGSKPWPYTLPIKPDEQNKEEFGTMTGYLRNRGIRLKPGTRGPDRYEMPHNAETVPGAPYDVGQRQAQFVGMETFYPKPKQRVFEGFSGQVLMPTETQRA